MIGLITKKIGMSQAVLDNGKAIAVTLLKTEPNVVVQIKSPKKDGYTAIQLGSGGIKKHYSKSIKGHLKGLDAKILKEICIKDDTIYKLGDKLDVSVFEPDDTVSLMGISKGKGFAGTIKRHNFSSGPSSHGHDHHRQPGSIGAMGMPRVHKGKRMAGRMGGNQVTIKNAKIINIDKKAGTIAVKGAVPGAGNGWILIQKRDEDE